MTQIRNRQVKLTKAGHFNLSGRKKICKIIIFLFTIPSKFHIIEFVGGVWLSLVRAHGWGP